LFCLSVVATEKSKGSLIEKKEILSKDKVPSMAFLNYLAEMTEVDGKLVGPQDMQAEKLSQGDSKKQQQDKKLTEINDKNVNDDTDKKEGQSNE